MLVAPATLAVLLFLVIPVSETLIGPLSGLTRFLDGRFAQAVVIRTLRIAALTTLISVVVGFATAIAVARTGPRLKRALLIAAVFPLLTGIVVRSFAWMVILGRNGMVNTLLLQTGLTQTPLPLLYSEGAVIVAMAYLFIPIMILTLVGVLDGIDASVIEAAASLGAGPMAAFRARDPAVSGRHGRVRLAARLHHRHHHGRDHPGRRAGDDPRGPAPEPGRRLRCARCSSPCTSSCSPRW